MKHLIVVLCLILGLTSCTFETESDMSKKLLQQRSRSGSLTPGGKQRINFQLPHFMNEQGYPDPGNYTVQFSIVDPNNLSFSGDFVRARAEIVWSVSGNSVRRIVDCTDGMSVSGTAEGVAVYISDDSNITFSSVKPYAVSLQVAKGVRPAIQQPPVYSLGIVNLDPDSSIDIPIPLNIGAVSVAVAVTPTAIGTAIPDYSLRVQQISGTTIRKMYDPRQEFWVPLAGGSNKIGLQTGPSAPATEFQITLGIDG